jgi:FkbM family methyltransferase
MVRSSPAGHHIAYEPLPDFHRQLVPRFPPVDVRNAALSTESGERSFTYVRSLPTHSGFLPRKYPGPQELESITVRVEALDSDLPPGYAPAFIKIDAEGAEAEVIAGGIDTIRTAKPIVVFEHGKGAADAYGTTPDDVFELLCVQAGLRLYDIDGGGPLSKRLLADIYERNRIWTFVARP